MDTPWEYLYDREYGFIGLSPETALVRYVEIPAPVQAFPISPPLRILTMISAPSDLPRLQGDQEWSNLSEALKDLIRGGIVQAQRLEVGTLSALQRPLRLSEYHVLHFVGHGLYDENAQDGALALEDAEGKTRLVTGRDLGLMLRGHRSLRLVVLNACEGGRSAQNDSLGGVAQALVRQGIPAVIAMQFEISDPAALVFSRSLYEAIADGLPVDVAMVEARRAMFAEGHEVEWATPVLYLRSLDGEIFAKGQIRDGERNAPEDTKGIHSSNIAQYPVSPTSAATTHAEQGDNLRSQHRYSDAETAYRAALELDPHLPRAHVGLSQALYGIQQYESAEVACSEAIRLDPANAATHRIRGDILRELKRWAEAEAAYQEAIRLASSPTTAHDLNVVLEDVRRHKEAHPEPIQQKQSRPAVPTRSELSQIDLRIGLVGAQGSGKTVLMTVLVKHLRDVAAQRFEANVTIATTNPGGYRGAADYQASVETPLYVDRVLPPATPSKCSLPLQQQSTPVVLRWRQEVSRRLRGASMRSTLLHFFDTSGEDLNRLDEVFCLGYLYSCNALILTIDPCAIPGACSRLSLPPAAIKVPDDAPLGVMDRITDYLRTEHRIKVRDRIRIPVAVVVTKIDVLYPVLDHYSFLGETNPIFAVPTDQPAYNETEGQRVHEQILSLLNDWKAADIDTHMQSNYADYRYFGVSALGVGPSYETGKVALGGVEPHRVEDPVLWLMSRAKSVPKM